MKLTSFWLTHLQQQAAGAFFLQIFADDNISWCSMLTFDELILQTANWYKRVLNNEDPYFVTSQHIKEYFNLIFEGNKIYA